MRRNRPEDRAVDEVDEPGPPPAAVMDIRDRGHAHVLWLEDPPRQCPHSLVDRIRPFGRDALRAAWHPRAGAVDRNRLEPVAQMAADVRDAADAHRPAAEV